MASVQFTTVPVAACWSRVQSVSRWLSSSRAEHLVPGRRQHALGFGELLGAGVGELDQVPQPVLGRAPPLVSQRN